MIFSFINQAGVLRRNECSCPGATTQGLRKECYAQRYVALQDDVTWVLTVGEVMKNVDLTAISMALFVTLGFRLSFEHLVQAKNVVLSDLLNPLSVQQASSAAKAWNKGRGFVGEPGGVAFYAVPAEAPVGLYVDLRATVISPVSAKNM